MLFCYRKSRTKFFSHGRLDFDANSTAGRYVGEQCKPINRYIMEHDLDHLQLFDLIRKMLEFEPSRRCTLGMYELIYL